MKRDQLRSVFDTLEERGLIAPWRGRFGILGARKSSFLPASVLRLMPGMEEGESGALDFCSFVRTASGGDGGSGSAGADAYGTLYVGTPDNAAVCRGLLSAAGVEDVRLGSRVVSAKSVDGGGWDLDVQDKRTQGQQQQQQQRGQHRFDALVIATHDTSLAANAVSSIGTAGAASAEAAEVEQRQLKLLSHALLGLREGKQPAFCLSAVFAVGTSAEVPFDAATVADSAVLRFLARDASKPARGAAVTIEGEGQGEGGELWTAVSTTEFAEKILAETGGDKRKSEAAAAREMGAEVSRLVLGSARMDADADADVNGDGDEKGGTGAREGTRDEREGGQLLSASAMRWGAAFAPSATTGGLPSSLHNGDDCVFLPAWQLAVAGDCLGAGEEVVAAEVDEGEQREGRGGEGEADPPFTYGPAESAMLSGMAAGERVAALIAAL